MRVLHIIPSTDVATGGPARALIGFVKASRAVGIDCLVVSAMGGPFRPEDWPDDVDLRFFTPIARRYTFSPRLFAEILQIGPHVDIIHVHSLFNFPFLAAGWTSVIAQRPLVIRPCGMLTPFALQWRGSIRKRLSIAVLEGPLLRRAAMFHFTSIGEKNESVSVVPNARAMVVPPPIDVGELPSRALARRELGVDDHEHLVLSVGRLDRIKRVERLIEALTYLPPSYRLAVVGPGDAEYHRRLVRLALEMKVSKRVSLPGLAAGPNLKRYWAAADVFVSASAHENFGLAIAEACAAGLCPVLPRELPIATVLGGAAVLVEATPKGLADGVRLALSERENRGKEARRVAEAHWSLDAVGGQLLDLYDAV